MLRSRPVPLALVLLALAAPAAAQTLRGRVVDARTGAPIPQAAVTAHREGGERARVRSGADGAFALRLPGGGTYRLRVERIGYREWESGDVSLGAGETLEMELRVTAAPVEVEEVRATARSEPRHVPSLEDRGFYARRDRGFGRFATRSHWKNRFNRGLLDLMAREPGMPRLTARATRVEFQRTGGTQRGRTQATLRRSGCLPRVFLDGVLIQIESADMLDDLAAPEHVEAIEFYRGAAQIPPEFQGPEPVCGVLVVWTRMGDGEP